ncbi:ELWxxDGT repeat protein [Candidatus Neomarinimicrobiota bacterium]
MIPPSLTHSLSNRAIWWPLVIFILFCLGIAVAQQEEEPPEEPKEIIIEREIIFVDREYVPPFVEINGFVYFAANDGTNGWELWRSDGTKLGTRMVKDINPWGSSNPRYLTEAGGTLFFQADDGIQGVELFSSDGTEFGTGMVMDIYPAQSSNPSHLFAMNGMLYFQANDGVADIELWRSDGTAKGTKMVREINPWRGAFPPAPHGTEWEDEWEESSQ